MRQGNVIKSQFHGQNHVKRLFQNIFHFATKIKLVLQTTLLIYQFFFPPAADIIYQNDNFFRKNYGWENATVWKVSIFFQLIGIISSES